MSENATESYRKAQKAMAFIPTPHAARVVVNWLKGTETFSYVFYMTKEGFDLNAQEDLATIIDAVHNATRKGWFSQNVSYLNTTVYDARVSDGPITTANALMGPATGVSPAVPINTAVCITCRTSGRGRSSRGRKFITGFGEGHIDNGEWQSSALTNAKAYVDAIHQAAAGIGWTWVIRSIQQDKQVQNPAVVRAVTSTQSRNGKVSTQRRRVDRP